MYCKFENTYCDFCDQDEVNYKKIAIVSGRSESPTSSMETPSSLKMGPPPTTKITRKQWVAIAILTFVNLINYMDRYTIAGKFHFIDFFKYLHSFDISVIH